MCYYASKAAVDLFSTITVHLNLSQAGIPATRKPHGLLPADDINDLMNDDFALT